MHFAHVERVIGRTQRLAVGRFGGEITGEIGIVVVVAHRVVDRHGIPLHRGAVVAQAVKIGVPELVPRHVAQHHQIGRHALCRSEGRRLGDKPLGELPEVARHRGTVGQMKVGGHDHHMARLIDAAQLEIVLLADIRRLRERRPESRSGRVGALGLVTRRQRDEHIPLPLVGREPIVTVGIGHGGLETIRHAHAGHRFQSAVDDALDRRPFAVGNPCRIERYAQVHPRQTLRCRPSHQCQVVTARSHAGRNGRAGKALGDLCERTFEASGPALETDDIAFGEPRSQHRQCLTGVNRQRRRNPEPRNQTPVVGQSLLHGIVRAGNRAQEDEEAAKGNFITAFHNRFSLFSCSTVSRRATLRTPFRECRAAPRPRAMHPCR